MGETPGVLACVVIILERSPVGSDPEVRGQTLVFRGTRVPAQSLLEHLQDGHAPGGVFGDVPGRGPRGCGGAS